MELPAHIRVRIDRWDGLSRWERAEIGRDLRRLGLSYGEIRSFIDVKKSTLATWCRDVVLTEEQTAAIIRRTGSRKGIPRDTQRKRRLEIEAIQRQARRNVMLLRTQPLWTSGTVFYWAEGNKTKARLGLANSDPRVIRVFIAWCRSYHDGAARFVLRLNLHADNDEPAARSWWADQSGLPNPEFYRSFIKPDGTGHRKNHLAAGVCMVQMRRSADAFHRTMAWIDALAACFDNGVDPRTLS